MARGHQPMRDERVILRAEQATRSFEWLLTKTFAEHFARQLRAKGWSVTIRPADEPHGDDD